MEIFSDHSHFDKNFLSYLNKQVYENFLYYVNVQKGILRTSPTLLDEISNECPINTYLGLEIELENINFRSGGQIYLEGRYNTSYPSTVIFKAVEDGSLRNDGCEFVSKIGHTGQEIIYGLKKLLHGDGLINPNVGTSSRTSVHVHVNCLDLQVKNIKKMVFWYLLLEPIFFKLTGDRDRNIFCVPLSSSYLPILRLLNTNNAERFWNVIAQWHKYCAFNIKPLATQGTIEFRHHRGSCDPAEIEDWLLFITQFVDSIRDDRTFNEEVTLVYNAWQENKLAQKIEEMFGIPKQILVEFNLEEHISNVLTKVIDMSKLNNQDLEDEMNKLVKKRKMSNTLYNTGSYLHTLEPAGAWPGLSTIIAESTTEGTL